MLVLWPCAAILSIIIIGCKREPAISKQLLSGFYVCNFQGPEQTIELLPNGTMIQRISGVGEYFGNWTTDAPDDPDARGATVQVELMPYHFHWPPHLAKSGEVGFWVANAKRISGKINLIVSDDDSLYCEHH
jgi:hypothetical protein